MLGETVPGEEPGAKPTKKTGHMREHVTGNGTEKPNQICKNIMSETQAIVKVGETSFVPLGESEAIKISADIIRRQMITPTASGKEPSNKEILDLVMLCRARKLNPFTGDVFLVGYDTRGGAKFNIIVSHMALLKRAEHSEKFDGMESGLILETDKGRVETQGDYIEPGQKAVGAWAKVYRKDQRIPTYRSLNISRYDKGNGLWRESPEMMGVKCAEADALRSAFPSSAGGLYLSEEMPEQPRPIRNMGRIVATEEEDEDGDLGPQKKGKK